MSRRIAVHVVLLAALGALGAWIYHPALHGRWLWDDGLEIADNAVLRDPQGWWKVWVRPTGLDYLPLKSFCQWIEWQMWGARPAAYHAVNIVLHVACAALFWVVLRRWRVREAWLGAVIFLVHPVAVESVAWIAEFKNGLSLAFLLCSFLAWERRPVLSTVLFVTSLLAKPTGIFYPVFLLILDGRRRRIWPMFAASLALGLVTVYVHWHWAMPRSATSVPRTPEADLLAYVRMLVFPAGLSPVYAPFSRQMRMLAWLLVVILGATVLSAGRSTRVIFAWFGLSLLPILEFVPMAYDRVAPYADHFAYLALLAFAAAAAGLASAFPRRWGVAWLAVMAGALALESHAYAAVFRSEGSLWKLAAERQPGAWLGRANYGRVLLDQGRTAKAIDELRAAVALRPDAAEVHANLGNALAAAGRWTDALSEYHRAIHENPRFAGARYDLGRAWLQHGEAAAAEAELREAVRLRPDYAAAHNNLGLALSRQGRRDEGLREYELALESDPTLAEAHLNIGNVYAAEGRTGDAAAEYRTALRLAPHFRAAKLNLARLLGGPGVR